MSKVLWQNEFSVGNKRIDTQHKMFLKIMNKIISSIENNESNDYIIDSIYDLKTYSKIHFYSEEEILMSFGYNELEEHKEVHNSFRAKVKEFEDSYHKGQEIDRGELLKFARHWLVNHIINVDKKYARLFSTRHAA